jgi:choline-sulfatase
VVASPGAIAYDDPMSRRPNILFLMTDQMQARVLEPAHPCHTPNLERLATRGVRFLRAYTPNAVCSPARASLMTGLLPHNHGVLWVTHTVDADQGLLRTDKPHWAQRLTADGYRTGYFGKWHVENTNRPEPFGWQVDGSAYSKLYRAHAKHHQPASVSFSLSKHLQQPTGYRSQLFYGVTDQPPETRPMGLTCTLAAEFLREAMTADAPWCCFVSVPEPHDPFVAGAGAFARYDVDALSLPPNAHDDLAGRPGLYRKLQPAFAGLTDRQHREAAACYFASITEIDEQFGRLINLVEQTGQAGHTIIVLTSDHGEMLGAHGLYCKNIMATEEVYNIPLIIAGPGIAAGRLTHARVGLHELCPTLLELTGLEPIRTVEARSFAPVLRQPQTEQHRHRTGYAEYHGGRFLITQRIWWEDNWKFVFNGFDIDELYDLERDPYEQNNLAADPAHADRLQHMMRQVWKMIRDTGDRSLWQSQYPGIRLAACGPESIQPAPA